MSDRGRKRATRSPCKWSYEYNSLIDGKLSRQCAHRKKRGNCMCDGMDAKCQHYIPLEETSAT